MDYATIQSLIQRLDDAGRYAFQHGAEFTAISAAATMVAAFVLALAAVIGLGVFCAGPLPEDARMRDDAIGMRCAAGLVVLVFVFGCAVVMTSNVAAFLAPEGALILRFLD